MLISQSITEGRGCIPLIGQAEALAYIYNLEQSQCFPQQASQVRKVGAFSKEEGRAVQVQYAVQSWC